MENIVSAPHNRGAMPREYEELQITDGEPEEFEETEPADVAETAEPETDKRDEPMVYTHVRAPELRRGGARILMGLTAVCGAVSGAVIALTGTADSAAVETISGSLVGTVGELFLRAMITGGVFLAAEFMLGFFALGDWLVWVLPLCYSMGVSLRVAALGTGVLLPSAAVEICAVAFGAATSASFSQTLLRLSRGGSAYRDRAPIRSYAPAFFGYAVMIAAAAVYEGIALNWK